MFSWIPIIGPIVQGIISIFTKNIDKEVVEYKSGADASVKIIQATKSSWGVLLTRDLIIFPVGVWTALVSWDTIVAIRYPNFMFHVADYPSSLSWLPYAVMTFILGTVAVNNWKR